MKMNHHPNNVTNYYDSKRPIAALHKLMHDSKWNVLDKFTFSSGQRVLTFKEYQERGIFISLLTSEHFGEPDALCYLKYEIESENEVQEGYYTYIEAAELLGVLIQSAPVLTTIAPTKQTKTFSIPSRIKISSEEKIAEIVRRDQKRKETAARFIQKLTEKSEV